MMSAEPFSSRRPVAKVSRSWLGGLLLVAGGCACGATQVVKEDRLHVSGMLSDADIPAFIELLDANPQVTKVVFDQCLGGTLSAGYGYARLIRQRTISTVARRQCSSACALGFLGGVRRSFDTSAGTAAIGLHLARKINGSGPASLLVNRRLLSFIEEMTGGKLHEPVSGLIDRSWSEASGVFFASTNLWLFRREKTIYCDGTQGRDSGKCIWLEGVDALTQGIVTER